MWELPRRMKALNIIINNKIVFLNRQMRLLLDIEFHLRIIFAVFHWDWPFLYVIQFQIRDDRMRNAIVIDYDLEWVCFRAFFSNAASVSSRDSAQKVNTNKKWLLFSTLITSN